MRHSGIPYFGYYPGAKAVTSLLRVAANLVPQVLLPGKPDIILHLSQELPYETVNLFY